MSCLSCSSCPVLSGRFCLAGFACPVLPDLFCLSCSAYPVLSVRFCLFCSACPVLPVLFCPSCSVCPVVNVLFCLSCSACLWLSSAPLKRRSPSSADYCFYETINIGFYSNTSYVKTTCFGLKIAEILCDFLQKISAVNAAEGRNFPPHFCGWGNSIFDCNISTKLQPNSVGNILEDRNQVGLLTCRTDPDSAPFKLR